MSKIPQICILIEVMKYVFERKRLTQRRSYSVTHILPLTENKVFKLL